MPQDYDLQIDGKSYGLKWDKPQPPTQADIEGIVAQYRAQAKQQSAPVSTPSQQASPGGISGGFAAGLNHPAPSDISSVVTGGVSGGASGDTTPSRAAIDAFRLKFFNDQGNNIPAQTAKALAANPDDPAVNAHIAQMQPVSQSAIREYAGEIAAENKRTQDYIQSIHNESPLDYAARAGAALRGGTAVNPIQQEAYRAQDVPGFNPSAAFKGTEGARQGKMTGHGALDPSLNVLADFAGFGGTPEGAAFGEAMGVIGSLGGKAAKLATGTAIGLGELDAANRFKQGDIQGGITSAALGLLPLGIHAVAGKIGEAADIAASKRARTDTANALDAQQAQIRANIDPNTPVSSPDFVQSAPVKGSRFVVRQDGTVDTKPGVKLTPDEQTQVDTHNATVQAQKAPQGEPNVQNSPISPAREIHKVDGLQSVDGQAGLRDSVQDATAVLPENGRGVSTGEVNDTSVPSDRISQEPTPSDAVNSPGIKTANAETNVNRSLEGLPDLPDHTWQSNEEIYSQAKDRGMDKNALNVADDVLKTGRAMDAHELAANALKQKDIRAERSDIRDQIKSATDAGTPTDSLLAEYDGLKDQYDKLTQATKRSGTAQSQAFAIRQYELDDYSHENIEQQLQMAKPDVPLAAADKSLVDTLSQGHDTAQEALTDAQDKLDAHLSGKDEIASQKAAETAIEGLKTHEQKAQGDKWTLRQEDRAKLDKEYEDLQKRFVSKTAGQANALVDPSVLPIIKDIAKNRVQYGITKVGDLVDAVHAAVEPHIPGITKREVRDAISGHGYGSPIPIGSKLSDLKEQMRLLSQIEDAKNKVASQSRTTRPVSDEVKALRQQKAEAIAENKPPRPRKQSTAETRLEGYKKQLSAKIDDLTRRISQKDFTAQGRSKLLLDPEAEQLKAQRDALQKVYNDLDPAKQKAPVSPKASKQGERAAQTRLDRLTKQFEDLKAQNRSGEYSIHRSVRQSDTPEEAAMRANVEAARRQRDTMRAASSEGTPADPLKSYKNQLIKQIAEAQTHIDSGFTDRASGRQVKQLDAEAKALRDQRDQMRENVVRKRAEIDRVIEARKGKSALDKYAIYHRAAILSRISTLAKLSSAAAQRALFTPIEDAAGGLMRAIPGYGKIADMAPHGSNSIESYSRFGKSLGSLTANSAEAKVKLKTGMNYMDARYGKHGAEADSDPINLFSAGQNAHGAVKTFIQRPLFEKSMAQQERYEARLGHDINDPAVRTVMEARAYMKSKDGILMQDNMLSTAWHGMVRGLETNPRLGKFGKNLAATARAAIPIVKVPTNFVGEVISHTPGVGLIRPAYELAISKGIENLSPEQADIITSALKKHAVGTALFALGYWQADKMGGFYHQGGNGMNDVKPNEVRINLFGKQLPDVPSTFLHSPQMEVMMMGAAFRQAIETAGSRRSRNEVNPAEEAVHRVASGVADSIPFVDTPKRLLQATEGSAQAGKAIGDSIGGATVPGFLPDIASQLDRDPQNHFQTRKRPVKGFGDALKTSIGARVLVPEDTGRKR